MYGLPVGEVMPKSASAAKAARVIQRWWLIGEEECPHCGQLYAYEAEYRCPDCDGPTCVHCLVLHEDRNVCPDCVAVRPHLTNRRR